LLSRSIKAAVICVPPISAPMAKFVLLMIMAI
jgi:hypothetical protein